jgi:ribosome-binding ATPase YchF (GTP1/OBG family)
VGGAELDRGLEIGAHSHRQELEAVPRRDLRVERLTDVDDLVRLVRAPQEQLGDLPRREPGLDVLARVGFDTLGLQTFLTSGPKESRAWTIRKGATAPEAAGVIHTDFQKGFIKAEVVSFDDLVVAGSVANARARTGKLGAKWPETAKVIYTGMQLVLTGQAAPADAMAKAGAS